MHRYFSLFLFLLVTTTALARDNNDHWVEVRSEHFTVMTDSNEKEARKAANHFEQMRSVFHTLFPKSTYDLDSTIMVVALNDKKGFQALEPAAYLAKGR